MADKISESHITWDKNPESHITWDSDTQGPVDDLNEKAAVDALVYSERLGVRPESILDDYENFSAIKKQYNNNSLLSRLKQSWDIGQKNTELG